MRRRFFHLASLAAALAATSFASGVALAQSSGDGPAKFTGVATTAGVVKRTITDVVPNGPGVSPFGVVHIASTVVTVPVSLGDNATTIGTNFRNAINGNVTLQSLGYSSTFSTPGTVSTPSRPKLTRQTGSYTVIDDPPPAGVGFTVDPFTVLDAPGLSPVGLGFLVGALPALVLWHRRRKSL